MHYILTFLIAIGTAMAAVGIHLVVIRFVLDRIKKTFVMMTTLLLAHILEVELYTGVYCLLGHIGGFGHVLEVSTGAEINDWGTLTYYSYSVYTTLGIGDLSPIGLIRILTGIESVVGLALIAWSATYSYNRFYEARQKAKQATPSISHATS